MTTLITEGTKLCDTKTDPSVEKIKKNKKIDKIKWTQKIRFINHNGSIP